MNGQFLHPKSWLRVQFKSRVTAYGLGVQGLRLEELAESAALPVPCTQIRGWGLEVRVWVFGIRGEELQGYLAHTKHPPVGPYSSPMHRDLW